MPDVQARDFLARVRSGRAIGHHHVALLGLRAAPTAKLIEQVARGLSFRAWERFLRNTGLDGSALAALVEIPPRTLTRRRKEGRLSPQESDRLVRASRVFAYALALFEGDPAAARTWLLSPQPALGGEVPFRFASTEIGAREVEALIGRLEHGVPS